MSVIAIVGVSLALEVVACGKRDEPVQPKAADAAPAPRRRPTRETGDPSVMQPAPVGRAGEVAVPEVRPVSQDVVMVGAVRVELAAKRVEAPARVVLEKGILEFAVVKAGGREYESAIAVDAPPLHVQTALLLAGFDKGQELRLRVRLPSGEERAVSTLMRDRASGEVLSDEPWTYQGSTVFQGQFMADVTGAVVALWKDESAIVSATTDRGNPYRGATLGLEMAPGGPPAGTKVTLIFQAEAEK
jgi:hypothetical protein